MVFLCKESRKKESGFLDQKLPESKLRGIMI